MKNIFSPDISNLTRAADLLAKGEVVVFPTETVYGLGANALMPQAISKIFDIKKRPQDNPIIAHLGNKTQISDYAFIQNDIQQTIIDKLMPGPITILLPKKNNLPDILTAGRELVGIRIPSNKIAQDLLSLCDFPVAAPSANLSTKPSPTSAQMVYDNFGFSIDMILDGGPCEVGIESTVVLVDSNKIIITRPGFVSREDLQELFDDKVVVEYASKPSEVTPGNRYKHYSPSASIEIFEHLDIAKIQNILFQKKKVGLILTQECLQSNSAVLDIKDLTVFMRGTENNLATCAKNLFDIYHRCDQLELDHVFIQSLPDIGIGYSIMNRVKKSAIHQ